MIINITINNVPDPKNRVYLIFSLFEQNCLKLSKTGCL